MSSSLDPKLFDTLLEPVFILTEDKKIIYCNEPAALLCDISPRKILRSHICLDELFQFEVEISHLNLLGSVLDPTPYQEVNFKTESERTGKVQITIQYFGELDSKKCWLVFFRDVTLEETLQKKYRKELEQKEDVILDLQKAQAELEKYSKNLEKMVAERTAQITQLNQMMSALLDSLHQGFFIFNQEGVCQEVFSRACEQTVQTRPAGKMIWDVLQLSEKQLPGFKKWMTTIFLELLPFEDLSPLGPQSYPHSHGLSIQLEYYPLRAQSGAIEGIVVVATDISKLIEAQQEAELTRSHAKMIVSLIQHKRQVTSFLQESKSLLQELDLEFQKGPRFDVENVFRCLHTLKGGAASFSIKSMVDQAHQAENNLSEWKNNPTIDTFEKLKSSSLLIEKHFENFLSENAPILGSAEKVQKRWVEIPADKLSAFQTRLPAELSSAFVSEFLMEPIGDFFSQYREVALNVAEREMKSLKPPEFENSDLRILPDAYSQLFSTFIHAYRNAVDHGIEIPIEREEAGKPSAGSIHTRFSRLQEGLSDWLLIEIEDDGAGIDPERIRAKLSAKGIDVSQKTDDQILQHVFDSQFSTREVVTETSGRGVGMDAIAHAARELGGRAWVESRLGLGTKLTVKVPFYLRDPKSSLRIQAA